MDAEEIESRELQRLIRNLFEARESAKAARKAMQVKAAEVGGCQKYNEDTDDGIKCYRSRKPEHEWCASCQAKHPVWRRRQWAANQAGTALRNLLRVARALPPSS